jgi:hypothetical protein
MKSVTQAWNFGSSSIGAPSTRKITDVHPGAAASFHLVEHAVGQIDHVSGHAGNQVGGVRRAEVPHELPAHRVVLGRVGDQHAAIAGLPCLRSLELGITLAEQPRRASADVGADPRIVGQRKHFGISGHDIGVLGDLGHRRLA